MVAIFEVETKQLRDLCTRLHMKFCLLFQASWLSENRWEKCVRLHVASKRGIGTGVNGVGDKYYVNYHLCTGQIEA